MERKSSTTTVTAEQVTAGLKKANTTAREEQVLRLRHGLGVDKKAPLPQAHGGNEELADELLVIEMQLLRAMKARAAANKTTSAKSKIVSKLRK